MGPLSSHGRTGMPWTSGGRAIQVSPSSVAGNRAKTYFPPRGLTGEFVPVGEEVSCSCTESRLKHRGGGGGLSF